MIVLAVTSILGKTMAKKRQFLGNCRTSASLTWFHLNHFPKSQPKTEPRSQQDDKTDGNGALPNPKQHRLNPSSENTEPSGRRNQLHNLTKTTIPHKILPTTRTRVVNLAIQGDDVENKQKCGDTDLKLQHTSPL